MEESAVSIALLRLFSDVASAGTLAAAARERGVDPSAVSRQIGTLENALGFRLFDRTTRRLSLTEAGRAYLQKSRVLVDELEIARQEATDLHAEPKGLLKVTASIAFTERWLMPRLQVFCAAYPEVDLDLKITDEIVDIAAQGIDIALRLTTMPQGSLIATKLMDTHYRVVASPEYTKQSAPISEPIDLTEHPCLLLALPGYRLKWCFRKDKKTCDVPVQGRIVASSPLALHRAALDGLGPTLLADWTVDHDIQSGRLTNLLPAWEVSAESFDTAAWIVYPSREYVPKKTRVFIDYLKANTS